MSSFYYWQFRYTTEIDGEHDTVTPTVDPTVALTSGRENSTGQQVCKVTTTPTQMYVSPSVMPSGHTTIYLKNIGDYPVKVSSSSSDELLVDANGGIFIGFWDDCDSFWAIGGTSYVVIYTGA